jgi:hypothetical protein
MANVNLAWDAPATRASGKPLKAADIAGFTVEQSVDGGAFTKLVDSPANETRRLIANLEPGTWQFRVSCFDTKNHVGAAGTASIQIDDDTPPGAVLNLTVSIAASLATSQG